MVIKVNLRSSDLIVMLIVLILFLSGLIIYLAGRYAPSSYAPSPTFHLELEEAIFNMGETYRSIELIVRSREGPAEIAQVLINNDIVAWQTDKNVILEGEESRIVLRYPWVMRETYTIRIITADNRVAEFKVRAPEEKPHVSLGVMNVSLEESEGYIKVIVGFSAEGRGISSFQALLFTYLSFNRSERTIYILYDERYMTSESLKRAKAIFDLLYSYNFSVIKADYGMLKELSSSRPECILIIVNPLKGSLGRKVEDALPAPLIDPDGDGFIRNNSKYGKSLLYDWMRDRNLILVTVGSAQPYKRILYEDGSCGYAKDSTSLLDAHIILTDADGEESILGGNMFIGEYSPTKITGTLGLNYRDSNLAFNKDSLEKYGLKYYGYGDYSILVGDKTINLTLPAFIKVGGGGWLSLGDEEGWLKPEEIAHDIFMLIVHSVWDSDWIPYGWYWDSGTTYYQSGGGIMNINATIETEFMPRHIIGEKLVIRLVGIAFSKDLGVGVRVEKIIEYSVVTP